MSLELILAVTSIVASALFSLITICWTIWFNRKQIRHHEQQMQHLEQQVTNAAMASNVAAAVSVASMITETPSVLRFHGVTEEVLQEAGLNAREFAYLLASCEAGSVWYDVCEKDSNPFAPDSMRFKMFHQDELDWKACARW